MTPGDTNTIAVDTLDNLIRAEGVPPVKVGFVKIDVEGHEYAVLEGMQNILTECTPIMVELTFDPPEKKQSRQRGRKAEESASGWICIVL